MPGGGAGSRCKGSHPALARGLKEFAIDEIIGLRLHAVAGQILFFFSSSSQLLSAGGREKVGAGRRRD